MSRPRAWLTRTLPRPEPQPVRAYIDRTGSGCETIAHAYENGRLSLLFISFGNTPRILRIFGHACVVEWDQPAFGGLVRTIAKGRREAFDGARAFIVCDIWEVQRSCGFGVPRIKKRIYAPVAPVAAEKDDDDDGAQEAAPHLPIEHVLREGFAPDRKLDELAVFEPRPTMDTWAAFKAQANTLLAYQRQNNSHSIDGLQGLRAARRCEGQPLWVGDALARLRRVCAAKDAVAAGFALALALYFGLTALKLLLLGH